MPRGHALLPHRFDAAAAEVVWGSKRSTARRPQGCRSGGVVPCRSTSGTVPRIIFFASHAYERGATEASGFCLASVRGGRVKPAMRSPVSKSCAVEGQTSTSR